MQVRVDTGRQELSDGERTLRSGLLTEARAHFQEALTQFRVPELRLGEAHALRGLAQVAARTGEPDEALVRAEQAIQTYVSLGIWLDRSGRAGDPLRTQTTEGELATLVMMAELFLRSGRHEQAREAIERSHSRFRDGADASAAGAAMSALGRLALHAGNYSEARRAFEHALTHYTTSDDTAGQVSVQLALAEMHRLRGTLAEGLAVAGLALASARMLGEPLVEGRVLTALGSLRLQGGDVVAATLRYREALPLVRAAHDSEVVGYTLLGLGECESRSGEGTALDFLVDGARLFGRIGHRHAVATALVRIAEHGARLGEHSLSLVAAESARRHWRTTDPVRGVGQALRLIVKALAGLERFRAAFLAVEYRAELAGHLQPNATAVRSYYRERAPDAWMDQVEGADVVALEKMSALATEEVLEPMLASFQVDAAQLSRLDGALAVVEAFAARVARPSPDEAYSEADYLLQLADYDDDDLPDDVTEELSDYDVDADETTDLFAEFPLLDEMETFYGAVAIIVDPNANAASTESVVAVSVPVAGAEASQGEEEYAGRVVAAATAAGLMEDPDEDPLSEEIGLEPDTLGEEFITQLANRLPNLPPSTDSTPGEDS